MKYRYLLLSIPTLFLLTGNALADSGDELSDSEFDYLTSLTLEELFDVTVTLASKTEESLFDVPSSISVITGAEIRRRGLGSLEDVLNYIPGFYVSREVSKGNGSKIAVRGKNTDLSVHVLFLLNGQRMNDIYTGGVSLINRNMAVDNIDRVEVIRGPGSALYGSGAFLGVVNIITASDQNKVSFFIDSNEQTHGSLNLSGQSSDIDWSLYLSGFNDGGEHYQQVKGNFAIQDDTRDSNRGYDLNLTLQSGDLSLFARHMQRTAEDFLIFGNLGNDVNEERTSQSSLALKYSTDFTTALSADFSLDYSAASWDLVALTSPAGIFTPTDLIGGPKLDSNALAINANFTYKLGPATLLTFGGSQTNTKITRVRSLFNYNFDLDQAFDDIRAFPVEYAFNREIDRDVTGLYLQARHVINDSLTVFVGSRHDDYSDFGSGSSSSSPRAAFIYTLNQQNKLKLLYGEAFRAPNFLELYDQRNPYSFGNPALAAEKAKTLEFAYGYQTQQSHFNLTIFQTTITDQITFGAVAAPSLLNPFDAQTYSNSDGSPRNSGMELDFRIPAGENILVAGGFTRIFSSDDMLTTPKDFGFVTLGYSRPVWQLNVNYLFRGKTAALDDSSAYALVDLNARYNLDDDSYLQLSGHNIFAKRYHTYSATGLQLPNRTDRYTLRWVSRF